ncbi:DUF4440 domain-containing protein [Sphingomicrobium aestuariivivum]|uniref:DUF4440 domain-containing protein n=1 Tax=Sphingomicrobium aestuariivivum TaxID=1582356 RepID=UPI001FD6C362|nr:DUF4440 domain-containing protein [Sphingomicrobium aestuariivivum]MCJ8190113.1 DUF4440 domain-containing protein [Sphingomicrobium aestuariivivum]
MADISASIETLEHRWMRGWIERDRKQLKKLTGRAFRFVVAASKPVLLDRSSLLDAAPDQFSSEGYRFGNVYCRRHGASVIFATQAELEMTLEGRRWNGTFWMQDLWRKGGMSRNWQLVERALSRTEDDERVAGAIRSLQLWR